MLGVVGELAGAPTIGLVDGGPHRRGDRVGVHVHLPGDVAGGASDGLDQGTLRTEETLLVGVEDGHQGNLW